MPSIFSRIIAGEIPVHKIYEDADTLAFMDIHPIQPGHVLVIPKKEVATFEQMEPRDFQALMAAVQLVAKKLKAVLAPDRVGVIIEGFEVDHVHVKLVPINDAEQLRRMPDPDGEIDHQQLRDMADKLRIG
jgi:histidine triad (HIT) family protein